MSTVGSLLTGDSMRLVACAIAIPACAYQPGSFRSDIQEFPGQHSTAGCVDLAVERRADLPDGGIVLSYAFGNRCEEPVLVDLAAVRVFGRAPDGAVIQLSAYDPRREIEPRYLDGAAVGHETVSYLREDTFVDVCVDSASVVHAPAVNWLCFSSPVLEVR